MSTDAKTGTVDDLDNASLCPQPARRLARATGHGIAHIQRLQVESGSACQVDLIDLNAKGVGIRTMIPLPAGAMVVFSLVRQPPLVGLYLSRVAHCTKLANGRYHIGMAIVDRREGHVNTTRIPEEWRKQ